MANEFELNDEQLEAVTGGSDATNLLSTLSAGNSLLQLNVAEASTQNFSGINLGDLSQSGATIKQCSGSSQTAITY